MRQSRMRRTGPARLDDLFRLKNPRTDGSLRSRSFFSHNRQKNFYFACNLREYNMYNNAAESTVDAIFFGGNNYG